MILPVIFLFAAYGGVSYASILLKGWNVTISEWFNPLAGFTWAKDPLCIPDTQVFPGGPGAQCGGRANSPGTGCAPSGDLLKKLLNPTQVFVNPLDQAKALECLGGKGVDELQHIAKDIWGWLSGHGGTGAPPPGVGTVGGGHGR